MTGLDWAGTHPAVFAKPENMKEAAKKKKKEDWRWQMRFRIDSPQKLRSYLKEKNLYGQVSHEIMVKIEEWERKEELWEKNFNFAVSPYYAGLVDWEDPSCPILAQFLPSSLELVQDSEEVREKKDRRASEIEMLNWDPLAEESHMPVRGLTHRYPDRVLWYLSHNCAVYCRFCMRKRKVSQAESAPTRNDWERVFDYIREHEEIKEVILSGGDPLSLDNKHIAYILKNLRPMKHLYSIRIHTRMPVTLPMRIDESLASLLGSFYPITLVTHFNHAKELSPEAKEAVRFLRMNGIDVLNQAVLLKGINDSLERQEELNLALLKAGVRPYYLHRCDEIPGLDHFRAPVAKGISILRALRGSNPGISIPRYVVDLPGGGGKVPLEPSYLMEEEEGLREKKEYHLKNWAGKTFTIRE